MTQSLNQETIHCLNELIETCIDGSNGFREAAQHTKSPDLRKVHQDAAEQRERFALELGQEVRRLGGTPSESGSVSGKIFQVWIDLKSKLGSGDAGILATSECGEDAAVKEYEKSIARLSGDTRLRVEQQLKQVRKTHDEVRRLRDNLKAMEHSHATR